MEDGGQYSLIPNELLVKGNHPYQGQPPAQSTSLKYAVIGKGNVPQIHEYAEEKIILVASQTMMLYEGNSSNNWECTRELDMEGAEHNKDIMGSNYFTMASRASIRPMGYLQLIPGFEHIPLVVVSGVKSLVIVNMRDSYSEPLIVINSTSAFGQQAFFFKQEDWGGHSLHFSQRRIINETGYERHNWARMPFKPDFIAVLREHFRLPYTNTSHSLKATQSSRAGAVREREEEITKLVAENKKLQDDSVAMK